MFSPEFCSPFVDNRHFEMRENQRQNPVVELFRGVEQSGSSLGS
jgi:hypothetical protein